MLKTGTVPVLPSGLNGPCKCPLFVLRGDRGMGSELERFWSDFGKWGWSDILGEQVLTIFLFLVKGARVTQPAEEEDEEEELRKLQAEMAM